MLAPFAMANTLEELPLYGKVQEFWEAVTEILDRPGLRRDQGLGIPRLPVLPRRKEPLVDRGDDDVVRVDHLGDVDPPHLRQELIRVQIRQRRLGPDPGDELRERDPQRIV